MTDTTTTVPTLDKDDVRAIRNADSVVFRITPEQTTLECIKKDRDEFGTKERRRDIVVRGTLNIARFDIQGDENIPCQYGTHSISSARFHEGWRTIASLLHTGDQVVLEFRGDHATNGYVKDANLHADELWLRVERGEGRTMKRLYFLIDVSITPHNSARMCRQFAY